MIAFIILFVLVLIGLGVATVVGAAEIKVCPKCGGEMKVSYADKDGEYWCCNNCNNMEKV